MTYSMRRIHDAVEASRAFGNVSISEDVGHLRVIGTFQQAALDAWQQACACLPEWLKFTCRDEDDQEIEIEHAGAGEHLKLHFQFESPAGSPCIFTIEGWRSLLLGGAFEKSSDVRLACTDQGFSTAACAISPWRSEVPTAGESVKRSQARPRRYVRCQSPDLMAPDSIEHWIVKDRPTGLCDAFQMWQEHALKMLVRALPNELYREAGDAFAFITGHNQRRLRLGEANARQIDFDAIQEVIEWVYLEGSDIDIRHTFLTSELSREWPRDKHGDSELDFCSGLARRLPFAFETADLLHKAHVRSGSKDTIKALADLRKSLSDEVQKLIQHTRDLSTSVWRDAAVAVGVAAFRIANSATTNGSIVAFGWVFSVLAAYIGISYLFNRSTSDRFVNIFESNKTAWRTKLYGFLDDDDYRTLYENPFNRAVREYHQACRRADFIVFMIVVIIGLGACYEFGWLSHIPSPPVPTPFQQPDV